GIHLNGVQEAIFLPPEVADDKRGNTLPDPAAPSEFVRLPAQKTRVSMPAAVAASTSLSVAGHFASHRTSLPLDVRSQSHATLSGKPVPPALVCGAEVHFRQGDRRGATGPAGRAWLSFANSECP